MRISDDPITDMKVRRDEEGRAEVDCGHADGDASARRRARGGKQMPAPQPVSAFLSGRGVEKEPEP